MHIAVSMCMSVSPSIGITLLQYIFKRCTNHFYFFSLFVLASSCFSRECINPDKDIIFVWANLFNKRAAHTYAHTDLSTISVMSYASLSLSAKVCVRGNVQALEEEVVEEEEEECHKTVTISIITWAKEVPFYITKK